MGKNIDLSIKYELQVAGIEEKDIEYILDRVKNRLSEENIDIELEKLGYSKVFTTDYNSYSEYDFIDIKYVDWG